MKRSYRCWAEIDLDALRENLAWLRHRVGPDVKILTVVKADAYGHGLKQIAALLMQSGTDTFGVANLAEAEAVRSVGQGWPILMLGACLPDEVDMAVRGDVIPTISSLAEAQWFSSAAVKWHKTVDVHVKVDTGMGRLGIQPQRAVELIESIQRLGGIRLQGLYTHYSSVEEDAEFSRKQRSQFQKLLAQLVRKGITVPLRHANNSGGILHEPQTMLNLVRPGLLVYGVVPSGQRPLDSDLPKRLRPALSLFCRVSFTKEIEKGTPISYGHTFVAPRKMQVATLTAGYGDGYLRAGSNRAEVLVQGRRCRVLGRITMDQMLADVSHVPDVNVGAGVVLIGGQGEERITVADVAQWSGTIPWEVLTNITYRVPRLYRGARAA